LRPVTAEPAHSPVVVPSAILPAGAAVLLNGVLFVSPEDDARTVARLTRLCLRAKVVASRRRRAVA
jgi:hypothetical protein